MSTIPVLESPGPVTSSRPATRSWSIGSVLILTLAWAILQLGGLFTPGLLDDVDSIYIEIAREMLLRHDFVTPYVNGIRFFDKPPLMYWMASASMAVFGAKDWAARIPLALGVLALILSVYALGLRLLRNISPSSAPDRGAFYAALAIATSIGPYLFTRFYIPDILLALWMTLAVHLFLIALDRLPSGPPQAYEPPQDRVPHLRRSFIAPKVGHRASDPLSSPQQKTPGAPFLRPHRGMDREVNSSTGKAPGAPFMRLHRMGGDLQPTPLLPCLAFAAVTALNVLTKGLIGLVFPLGFVFLYLALTRQLRLVSKLHPFSSTAVFLAIAAPWHILAALRTPAISLPAGLGLPATGGWAWFYLYNEHIARFLGRRIPHDYGQVPIWLFWLMVAIWLMPWATFLPGALGLSFGKDRVLKGRHFSAAINHTEERAALAAEGSFPGKQTCPGMGGEVQTLPLILWALLILVFFTLSSRQEYYSLPALPALALLAASLLARADRPAKNPVISTGGGVFCRRSGETPAFPLLPQDTSAQKSALNWHLYVLLPLATFIAVVCAWFAIFAPHPAPGADISTLLKGNPEDYNLSLGHLFDLTGAAMGLFRAPLAVVAAAMLAMGPGSYLIRRKHHTYAANLALAAAMTLALLAAHTGVARFYPILGSKPLALAINRAQQANPRPNDLIVLDGELTSGSTLIFYTRQQVHLLRGRVNGLWYGSFWPDAPAIFETEPSLHQLWSSPRRVFLFTRKPVLRQRDLARFGPVHRLASSGGKTILTNR